MESKNVNDTHALMLKLAEAGYHHTEALENVIDFDNEHDIMMMAEVEQQLMRQNQSGLENTTSYANHTAQQEYSSTIKTQWDRSQEDQYQHHSPDEEELIIMTSSWNSSRRHSIDAHALRKEAIMLALSDDDNEDYKYDWQNNKEDSTNGNDDYHCVKTRTACVNTKTIEHAATAATPTDDSENDANVIAMAENNHNTILVSRVRQKDPIRNTPGAFSIDGGTPIRRGISGMLTPMPPNNYSHTPSTFHSEQLLALSDDSLTCDVSGAPATELNVQVSWDAFLENEQQDELKPSAIEVKKIENVPDESPAPTMVRMAIILGVVAIALAVVFAVGITLGRRRGNSSDVRPAFSISPTSAPSRRLSDVLPELDPMVSHCSSGEDETLPNEVIATISDLARNRYRRFLSITRELNLLSKSDFFQIDSCRSESLSLLYLAMHEEFTNEDMDHLNSIPMTKYILAVLFISWNGMLWVENKRWLSNFDVCDWYGVECNAQNEIVSLYLSRNEVSGTIPKEIGLLSALENLRLDAKHANSITSRRLHGEIPIDLFRLTKLKELALDANNLSGSLPTELALLTSLEVLSLSLNILSGSLPPFQSTKLKVLELNSNNLSGSLPSELALLTSLEVLSVGMNSLSGALPQGLGKLTELVTVLVNTNTFTGTIPSELGLWSKLADMNFAVNEFSGTIPSELGMCPTLQAVNLMGNEKITGTLPSEIGQLKKLEDLDVSLTGLEGIVPDDVCQLRTSASLIWFPECNHDGLGRRELECPSPECCTHKC